VPGAFGFVFGARQQVNDQRFLTIVEGVIDLFVVTAVDLRARLASRAQQRTERRQLKASPYQRFNADVNDVGDDIFAMCRFEHGSNHDALATGAERFNTQVVADQSYVLPAELTLLVLLEAIGDVGEFCNSGDMLHNPRRDSRQVREVPQPLKGLE
jgi:hypothetical protein